MMTRWFPPPEDSVEIIEVHGPDPDWEPQDELLPDEYYDETYDEDDEYD